jgi:diguanylate cyclase (GGDEF)-like protein
MRIRIGVPQLQEALPHAGVVAAVLVVFALGAAGREPRLHLLLAAPVAASYFLWGGAGSAALAVGAAVVGGMLSAGSSLASGVPLLVAAAWGTAWAAGRVHERAMLALRLAQEEDEAAAAELERQLQEERARISAARQRIEKIHMLTDVADALSSTLELRDVASAVLERTRELTGQAGTPRLALLDEMGALVFRSGEAGTTMAREDPDSLCEWVRARGLPLWVDDIGKDPRFRSAAGLPAAGSVIAAPLVRERAVMGVLLVESAEPGAFTQEDWRLLSLLADLASVAIQNARLYQRTQEEAITDGLTGVYVHRFFQERLAEELRRCVEQRIPLALLMADLDNFKAINDAHGHLAGDAVLKRVAGTLREGVRGTDLVARYGGEEFAVLLVETTLEAARQVAERLRASVAAVDVSDLGLARAVTISIGLAAHPDHGVDGQTLVERADEALYAAKRAGKNRVAVAGEGGTILA